MAWRVLISVAAGAACVACAAADAAGDGQQSGRAVESGGTYRIVRDRLFSGGEYSIAPGTNYVVISGPGRMMVLDDSGRTVSSGAIDLCARVRGTTDEYYGCGEDGRMRSVAIPTLRVLMESSGRRPASGLFVLLSVRVGERAIIATGARELGVYDARAVTEIGSVRLPIDQWIAFLPDAESRHIVALAEPDTIVLIAYDRPLEPKLLRLPSLGPFRSRSACGLAGGCLWQYGNAEPGVFAVVGTILDESCRSFVYRFRVSASAPNMAAVSPNGQYFGVATLEPSGSGVRYMIRVCAVDASGALRLVRQEICATDGWCHSMVLFDDGERVALFGHAPEGRFVRVRRASSSDEVEFARAGPELVVR
ncbi:MAG: hypothetical protein IT434_04200 [Phycisphaerales bacterium]|nr:hypothetical protein [Phycisphaerales bacterium]